MSDMIHRTKHPAGFGLTEMETSDGSNIFHYTWPANNTQFTGGQFDTAG